MDIDADDFWKHDMVLRRDSTVKHTLPQDKWRNWFSQMALQKTADGRKQIYRDFITQWNNMCTPDKKVVLPAGGSEATYKKIVDKIVQMDGYSNFSQTAVLPTNIKAYGPEYIQLSANDSNIYFTGSYDSDLDDSETTKLFFFSLSNFFSFLLLSSEHKNHITLHYNRREKREKTNSTTHSQRAETLNALFFILSVYHRFIERKSKKRRVCLFCFGTSRGGRKNPKLKDHDEEEDFLYI